MTVTDNYARLRWACRRGMLELDLLLIPFFEKGYASLDEAKKQQFAQLLTCQDQELYNWFIKRESVPDPHLIEIINIILLYAQTQAQN